MGGEGGAARKTAWLLPRPRGLSGNSPRAEEKPFLEKTLCRDCRKKKKKKPPREGSTWEDPGTAEGFLPHGFI